MLNLKKYLTVKEVIDLSRNKYDVKFKTFATKKGLQNKITTKSLNRPGLVLSGYFKNFAYRRIQIFGLGEFSYIEELNEKKQNELFEKFFQYKIPVCIFTFNNKPSNKKIFKFAEKNNIPILITKLSTSEFEFRFKGLLDDYLSKIKVFHGVMVEVFGIGILILGDSGVGKSEAALDLVSRGHRLVADDVVFVKKIHSTVLVAFGSELTKYFMEIRGLGIIDIKNMFGTGAIMREKQVDLIVELEDWISDKEYERIGIEEKYQRLLGVKIPTLVIPVKPGRNIPVIIETAAKDKRAKNLGYHSSLILNETIKNSGGNANAF